MNFPSIILRLPRFFILILLIDDRRIENHRRGTHALIYRRRVNDRLEGGAGLAVRLHSPIVLAAAEIVASDHGSNSTLAWLQRDQPALNEGSLFQLHICAIAI